MQLTILFYLLEFTLASPILGLKTAGAAVSNAAKKVGNGIKWVAVGTASNANKVVRVVTGNVAGGVKNVGNGVKWVAVGTASNVNKVAKSVTGKAVVHVPHHRHPKLHKFASNVAVAAGITGGVAVVGGVGFLAADHVMNKKATAEKEDEMGVAKSGATQSKDKLLSEEQVPEEEGEIVGANPPPANNKFPIVKPQ